jgi:ABC-2 type transport system ATP-binding protein
VSDRIAFLHEGRLVRYGRLDELLRSTGEVEIVLRNFAADAEFAAQWGDASAPGRWRIPASEVRRFLEMVWTHGAELVSVTPVRGDLTSLFLQWASSEAKPR